MKIDLPDGFVKELEAFRAERQDPRSPAAFIEAVVADYMYNWPWDSSDICVHCDECMHRKTVAAGREKHK
jgi:hypothetical protein